MRWFRQPQNKIDFMSVYHAYLAMTKEELQGETWIYFNHW